MKRRAHPRSFCGLNGAYIELSFVTFQNKRLNVSAYFLTSFGGSGDGSTIGGPAKVLEVCTTFGPENCGSVSFFGPGHIGSVSYLNTWKS